MSNNSLTGIERDVILSSLTTDKVSIMMRPLSVMNEHISTLTLTPGYYFLINRNIFYFPVLNASWRFENKMPVQISFFYKGRGLYFMNALQAVKKGWAIVVPRMLFKMTDTIQSSAIHAEILFSNSQKVQTYAYAEDEQQLFLTSNSLYNYFNEGEDISLAIMQFFQQKKQKIQSIERFEPLILFYLSEKHCVFGSYYTNGEATFLLQEGVEYKFNLFFPLPPLKRKIIGQFIVKKYYTQSSAICAVCEFTQIGAEDRRFLYEKTHQRLYN